MDVRIKQTGYTMPPETAAYLDERLRSLEKLLGTNADAARCEVELGRDAGRPKQGANIWFVEILLSVPGGAHIRATNRSESINGAIDDVKEEAERQLRKEKQMHIRVIRKSGAALKRLMRWGGEE